MILLLSPSRLLFCCSLFLATTVSAESWFFEPSVSLRLGYDDNVRLSVADREDDLIRTMSASAAFGVRTEVSDVAFTLQLDDSDYADLSDLDSSNQALDLSSSFRTERSLLRLNGYYKLDSTNTSELETTGRIGQESKRRVATSLSPSWSYDLTERLSTNLGYSYTDVIYEDAELTDLSDYREESLFATLSYRLSELNQVSATINGSTYEADKTGRENDTRGISLGFTGQLSETLSTSLSVGMQRSSTRSLVAGGAVESTSDNSLTLDIGLQKSWERSSLNGTISMGESPSGSGTVLRTNQLGLGYSRQLSPRTTFSVNGSLVQNSSGGGLDDAGDDRLYLSVEPSLSWQASRWWTLSTSYRYRAQEYTGVDSGVAKSNAIFLNTAYTWPHE